MTTIETPTEEPTEARRTAGDGRVQTAMTAFQVKESVRKARLRTDWKNHVVKARGSDGTGTYGLYLEVVNTTPSHESHTRYFVVGENLYASSRPKGATKANWRHRKVDSLEKILTWLDGVLTRPGIKLFGRVLIVELEADSVAQIEEGQLPAARFRGQYRIGEGFREVRLLAFRRRRLHRSGVARGFPPVRNPVYGKVSWKQT